VLEQDEVAPRQSLAAAEQAVLAAWAAGDLAAEAAASVHAAEARLLVHGPGDLSEGLEELRALWAAAASAAATEEEEEEEEALGVPAAGGSSGSRALPRPAAELEQRVLRLLARAALAQQQPLQALELADQMAARTLWRAAARRIAAVAHRLAEAREASIAAAEEAVKLGRELGDAEEAVALLCLAEARLSPPLPPQRCRILPEEAIMAERASRHALELFRSLGPGYGRGLSAALELLVRALLARGLFAEAAKVADAERASARALRHPRAEAGALAALVLAHAESEDPAAGTLEQALAALSHLPTLGGSGEAAEVQVALIAASLLFRRSLTSAEGGGRCLDEAASYAQRALALARRRGDLSSEVDVLRFLTRLHEAMGMDPPRSPFRRAALSKLRADLAPAVAARDASALSKALAELAAVSWGEAEAFLTDVDLQQVLLREAELSAAGREEARDWIATHLQPLLSGMDFGWTSPQGAPRDVAAVGRLGMYEVAKEPLYARVRAAGIAYGPRFRQVQGFKPAVQAANKPPGAVVAVLRPSSLCDEWEKEGWDWNPSVLDAAAHSVFGLMPSET
ncbi:unnamed protein product, partial [Polarella glacialis]